VSNKNRESLGFVIEPIYLTIECLSNPLLKEIDSIDKFTKINKNACINIVLKFTKKWRSK